MTDPGPFDASEYVALFLDLFDASSDAVFLIGVPDGRILAVNDTALGLFGRARPDAIGSTTLDLGFWVDSRDPHNWIAEVRDKGRVKGFRARLRSRWSEEFTMMLSGTLARYRGEQVILGVGTLVRST